MLERSISSGWKVSTMANGSGLSLSCKGVAINGASSSASLSKMSSSSGSSGLNVLDSICSCASSVSWSNWRWKACSSELSREWWASNMVRGCTPTVVASLYAVKWSTAAKRTSGLWKLEPRWSFGLLVSICYLICFHLRFCSYCTTMLQHHSVPLRLFHFVSLYFSLDSQPP